LHPTGAGRLAHDVAGALCGATLGRSASRSRGREGHTGAVVGALRAIVGSYTLYLRRELTRHGLHDLPIALAKDALALGGGVVERH